MYQLRISTQAHAHMLVLLCKGIQGEHTLKNNKRKINKVLPENKNMELVYTGTKLGTKFNVKGKTKKEHHHDLANSVKCPVKDCIDSYNGETGRRLIEQVNERSGKDVNSHMFKCWIEANQPRGDTHMTSILRGGGEGGQSKNEMLSGVVSWGVASVLDVQSLFFY